MKFLKTTALLVVCILQTNWTQAQSITALQPTISKNPICSNGSATFSCVLDPTDSNCYYSIVAQVQRADSCTGTYSNFGSSFAVSSISGNINGLASYLLSGTATAGAFRFKITYKYDSNCGTQNCIGDSCNMVAYSPCLMVSILNVNAGPDRSRGNCCACVSIGSSAIAGATYLWSPTTGLSSSTIAQPCASPSTTPVNYTMTITSGSTVCTDVVQVTISGVGCCKMNETPGGNFNYIYPNPANGSVTVKNSSLISQVTIYDLQGRNLKEIKGNLASEQKIDIEGLKSGVYVIAIVDGEGHIVQDQFSVK